MIEVDVGTTRYMHMSMNGFMLPWPPYSPYRGKYLCGAAPSEVVTHEFYRQLYPNIVRDIDVSSLCMLSFHMLYEIRELWVEGERKGGREGRGTGEEWGEIE